MRGKDLEVDGNAVAGALREVFSFEVTTARVVCGGCGAVGDVGAMRAFVHAPGLVVRCSQCDAVLMRLVQAPGRRWLDLQGTASLELRGL